MGQRREPEPPERMTGWIRDDAGMKSDTPLFLYMSIATV